MMAQTTITHRREHLKSKSAKNNREKFVHKLRNDCIARAQQARRLKIQQARQLSCDDRPQNGDYTTASSTLASSCIDVTSSRDGVSSSNKRGREPMHLNNTKDGGDDDQYQRMVDHVPMDYSANIQDIRKISGGVSDEGVLDTAKLLVEHELQRALTGLRHCEQMQQGEPLCKKVYNGSFSEDEEDEEYKISQEEFVALLAEVTEELQREEELLEEELWELERADALERERLLHEIDDYDDWEELQQQQQQQSANVYTSPFLTNMSSRVTCPMCNSASLIQTLSGGIHCSNAASEQCSFALDTNDEGLTLNNLSDRLRTVYEEHANVCQKGVLKFYVDNRGFISTLMARCEECQDEIIVV